MAEKEVAKAKERRAERERWLQSSEARQQRASSKSAYRSLGRSQARTTLESQFAQVLASLTAPVQPVDPSNVSAYLDDNTARVTSGNEPRLLFSSAPLRARDENGALRPINLALVDEGSAFQARNPLVDVSVPAQLDQAITLATSEGRLGIRLAHSGGALGTKIDDTEIFYPNVATDSDLVVASAEGGVEVVSQLRSPDSPEVQRFDVDLPEGGELHDTSDGAVEISSKGQTIATVQPPAAVDAQGEPVATSLEVAGGGLEVRTLHRGRDLAYPILVDPLIQSYEFINGHPGWSAVNSGGYGFYICPGDSFCAANSSPYYLNLWSYEGAWFIPGQYALWYWTAPHFTPFNPDSTTAWIERVDFNNVYYYHYGNYTYDPILALGMWDWRTNAWSGTPYTATGSYYDIAGANISLSSTGNDVHGAMFYLWNTGNYWHDYRRSAWVSHTDIYLTDPEAPTASFANDTRPSGWVDHASPTFDLNASDPGLGIQGDDFYRPKIGGNLNFGALGSYELVSQLPSPTCTGTSISPCPTNFNRTFSYDTASMPEGIRSLWIDTRDPLGGSSHTKKTEWTTSIDRTPPQIQATGTLTTNNNQGYALDVHATDGDATSNAMARSGMKSIQLLVDNQQVAFTGDQPCTPAVGSCALDLAQYQLSPASYVEGDHQIKVVAKDQLNHSATQEWTKTVENAPPSIDSIQGPTGWLDTASGSITVNAQDAGPRVEKIKLTLPGGQQLEHSFTCSPLCPRTASHQFNFDPSPFAEGAGTATARAYGPGNAEGPAATTQVKVDHSNPGLELSGSLIDPEVEGNDLHVRATDGDASSASTARSGVIKLELFVDGVLIDTREQQCTASLASCVMDDDFSLDGETIDDGLHQIRVKASDQLDHSFTETETGEVRGTVSDVEAPPLDQTQETPIDEAAAFLYEGDEPVQEGVVPGSIDPARATVIRGLVRRDEGTPLAGVTVSIFDHPEWGTTQTTPDGRFSMAANGGTTLRLRFESADFLPADRQIEAPILDYAWLEDVALIQPDTAVEPVSVGTAETVQSTPVTDGEGTRQQTLIFPEGQTATMNLPDGSTEPLTQMDVRATEFTDGEDGPRQMPAALPPTSAYTYAFELSADQALDAGAESIDFSEPVAVYNENFLEMPVGTPVPLGYYSREDGAWLPEQDGRVIEILSETTGQEPMAVLDVDGQGQPATQAELDALGITDDERERLAVKFDPTDELWRFAVNHFSTYDGNMPNALYAPEDAIQGPEGAVEPDQSCETGGSLISCERMTLGEDLELVGTDMTLHYRSDRVEGYDPQIKIPVSGASLPPSLKRIRVRALIGGRRFQGTFPPEPDQNFTVGWDGTDAFGRPLQGPQTMTVRIGYIYPGGYSKPGTSGRSFGSAIGGSPVVSAEGPERFDVTVWRQYTRTVGTWEQKPDGLGGWSLSAHHHYDPVNQVLYMGDGSKRSLQATVINKVAGGGSGGDGEPAKDAALEGPEGVDLGPDGSLYVADFLDDKVRRVYPDGHIDTIAGNGTQGFSGDGGPATSAKLNRPSDVQVAPDGGVFIADLLNQRIRRVSPDGTITTVVGDGGSDRGDGGPAVDADLDLPDEIELAPDGTLYLLDREQGVRRVDPGGYISTVAGGSTPGQRPTAGNPIQDARYLALQNPRALALDKNGNLYVGESGLGDNSSREIFRVSPDGQAYLTAGDPDLGRGFSGDGGPATEAQFASIHSLAVGPDGSLYAADGNFNNRIRKIDESGIISSVVGDGRQVHGAPSPDGKPASQTDLWLPTGLDVGPDGSIYTASRGWNHVDRFGSPTANYDGSSQSVPSEDGSELYTFSPEGRHLTTHNAYTGALEYSFAYDSAGRLTSVIDGDGNLTTIAHDAAGNPTTITAPFGQQTTLSVDGNGYLNSATNPEGESFEMTSSGDGLLQSFETPKGHTSTFDYWPGGRLKRDTDAAGGFKNLTRSDFADRFSVDLATKMGRQTSFEVRRADENDEVPTNPDGLTNSGNDELRTVTNPAGLEAKLWTSADRGAQVLARPDGTSITRRLTGDPRFDMQSPYASSTTVKTPAGLQLQVSQTRQATLSNQSNPLSLQSSTTATTVNGRTYTSAFLAPLAMATLTTPADREIVSTVDDQARPLSIAYPDQDLASFSYDGNGRLSTSSQGGRDWSYDYDADGNVSEITDSLDRTHGFAYDDAGRLTLQTLPDGRQIAMSYDDDGNLSSFTPPSRPAHSFAHNATEDPSSYTAPDVGDGGQPTQYSYNDDHDLTKVTRPDGSELTIGYDGAGRPQTVTEPGGPQTSLTYSSQTGQVVEIDGPGGVDLDLGQDGPLPTQETLSGPVAGSASRSYDSSFRITETKVNGANAIGFSYDADSLLSGAGALVVTRDPESGFISGTTLQGVTDSTTYNGFGEPDTYAASYGSTGLYDVDYARDDAGRITEKTETTPSGTHTTAYSYDAAGRLEEVSRDGNVTATYAYDANGNRTSVDRAGEDPVSATYDAQDRIQTYGDLEFDFTKNGDLAAKTDTTSNETTTYDYDALGNLDSVELPSGDEISYLTDGLGRRVGRKINGQLTDGFLYGSEALGPIAELDAQGNVRSRFVYATSPVVPDYMVKAGTTYRLVRDQLGSPLMIVNAQTGAVAQEITYDEFGRVDMDTNPGFQPFGFGGGLYDSATALVRFDARDYDAETGRWTSKDPIGFAGGDPNLFGYVFLDPVNLSDPSGLCFGPDAICEPIVDNFNPHMPSWGDVGTAAVATADGATLGLTREARELLGGDNINYCSEYYHSGEIAGVAATSVTGGRALATGLARGAERLVPYLERMDRIRRAMSNAPHKLAPKVHRAGRILSQHGKDIYDVISRIPH